MKITSVFLTAINLLIILGSSVAQQSGIYYMAQLPQRSFLNPAFAPDAEMHIGLPVISGTGFQYANNAFSYSDIFTTGSNNMLQLHLQPVVDNASPQSHISLAFETDLLSAGVRIGSSYFSLNATEKINFDFTFSKQFADFLVNGNAATIGTVQHLDPSFEGIHYREYAIRWSGRINSRLQAGVSMKYLYGMENIALKGNGLDVFTDPDDYTLTASSDWTINTSGIDSLSEFSIGEYAFGKKNKGYAVDIGFTYIPFNKLEISGSVVDLGAISFKSNVSTFSSQTNNQPFVFSGINLNEFINNDSTSNAEYFQNLGDSLYNSLDINTTHTAYRYSLPAKIFITAAYGITDKLKIYGLVRHRRLTEINLTDYQLGFSGRAGRILGYSISMNSINKTAITPGAGLTLKIRSNQIYFITDNVLSVINWKNAYHTGFRAGYNLVFGKGGTHAPQPDLTAVE